MNDQGEITQHMHIQKLVDRRGLSSPKNNNLKFVKGSNHIQNQDIRESLHQQVPEPYTDDYDQKQQKVFNFKVNIQEPNQSPPADRKSGLFNSKSFEENSLFCDKVGDITKRTDKMYNNL